MNCILCVEDIKLKLGGDAAQAQLLAQISQLNDTLVSKACKVAELEDALRQANILVSQVCNNNYRMMLNKVSDFMRQQD